VQGTPKSKAREIPGFVVLCSTDLFARNDLVLPDLVEDADHIEHQRDNNDQSNGTKIYKWIDPRDWVLLQNVWVCSKGNVYKRG
jgi:hypothetical protein